MASILRVNTLTDASSNNSIAMSVINQGTAKCWTRFDGTGTPSHADSFNMGSITDTGTGNQTTSFTSNMGSGNYSATVNAKLHSLSSNEYRQTTVDTFAAGSIKVQSLEPFLGGGDTDLRQVDNDLCCVTILGDLA